jgi:serine phosphatase RsbU (regulator of sigma subunit)
MEVFPDAFLWSAPRDFVSGDFLWMRQVHGCHIIAVCDCTGHGVPAALLSILGSTLLEQMSIEAGEMQASTLLEKIRSQLTIALESSGHELLSKSGMDVSLCIWEPEAQVVQFAGAYQPLVWVHEGSLELIKGTRAPCGGHLKSTPFQNHSLQVSPGDVFYLFTDGLTDQNGLSDEKYKTQRFCSFAYHVYTESLTTQKTKLIDEFECWKATKPQLDDVLVIGFRIPDEGSG